MTCPDCRGARERAGLGCGPAGCRPMVIPCETCTATGEISEERGRWITEGQRLHHYRLVGEGDTFPAYRSMLAVAAQHGVTLGQWADAEMGRVDPAPLIARVLGGA